MTFSLGNHTINFRPQVLFFFLIYFIIGLAIFRDYGVSWDEPYQRQIGYVTFEYLRGDTSLLTFTDRYYGQIFELPLVVIERVFSLTDTREIYYFRHLATFLLFYAGVGCFYILTKNYFKSWKIGLFACILLILSPRIFADSFYNSKDIPLLVFYIFATTTLLQYTQKKDIQSLLLHCIASVSAISARIIGGVFPFATIVIFFFIFKKNPQKLKKHFLLYILFTTIGTYLLWPVLWTNPLRIFEAVTTMAQFKFQTNLPTLYMGNFISTFQLPWHYIPTWILITTPLSFILLSIYGLYVSIKKNSKMSQTTKIQTVSLIFLLCFPVITAIILRSTLYDGWRHFYFIYPIILIFTLIGWKQYPKIGSIIIALDIIYCIYFMFTFHPYQNIYFSPLFSRNMQTTKQQFEMDYWGVSYRKALEYVVKTDPNKEIKIVVANNPGNSNALILPQQDRDRIQFLSTDDIAQADYFISNYRWHPKDYTYQNEVFSVKIQNAKIMVVYKLK